MTKITAAGNSETENTRTSNKKLERNITIGYGKWPAHPSQVNTCNRRYNLHEPTQQRSLKSSQGMQQQR